MSRKRRRNSLKPISLENLMDSKVEKVNWLVEGLIPKGGITILSAEPGSYKTWLLLDIIKSVASGTPLFNKFPCSQGNVLLIDEENMDSILKQRFTMLRTDKKLGISLLIKRGFKADNEKNIKSILRLIKRHKISLVCLDSLVRVHSKEENDAKQMAQFFNAINSITDLKATVIITHHNRKQYAGGMHSSSQNLRGSSDILAAIDCNISIKYDKDKGQLILSHVKLRTARELDPFVLLIKNNEAEGSMQFEFNGENITVKKSDTVKENILKILEDGQTDRNTIDNKLESKYGKNAIGEGLKNLIQEEKILRKKTEHNKKLYRLS